MIDERLEEAVIKTGAKLLILDPIQAYLGGGMDMNRANEARDMTKEISGTGREIPVCDCPCRAYEQSGRK